MKTLAFFHRLELTDLFGPVSQVLPDDIRCVHVAYSRTEADQLARLGIDEVTVFKDEIAERLINQAVPDAQALARLDAEILAASAGAFTLNSAIQSDRALALLPYDECLRIAATYLSFWEDFVRDNRVDHILHEPVSLLMNFMAAVALQNSGGSYLYCIMTAGHKSDYNFMIMSGIELFAPDVVRALASPDRAVRPAAIGRVEIQHFLDTFRSTIANFQGGVIAQSVSFPVLAAKALYQRAKRLRGIGGLDPRVDCIECWERKQNLSADKLRNLVGYRTSVRFDEPRPGEIYWFYPFHLEPEAVVLYQAHGLYTNQVKLIENIAAQLPAGHYLYVKDHPHNLGYREAADYVRLNAVPNIRLLPANIPGKALIRDARGVITITGTAGFEAMLMGKPVAIFGQTFYSQGPDVALVRNIRDLRAVLAKFEETEPAGDDAILNFLAAYLGSIHTGMTDFFVGQAARSGLDPADNARNVADGLARTVRLL